MVVVKKSCEIKLSAIQFQKVIFHVAAEAIKIAEVLPVLRYEIGDLNYLVKS